MKKSIKKYKSFLEVIFSAALSVLFFSILCSCGKDEPDLSSISEIPGTFLEAVKNLDRDAAFECSPEFDSSEWDELNEDQKHIMQSIMSYAEITEMEDPVFYEETGIADMKVTISYISIEGIVRAGISRYVTEARLSEVLEDYDDPEDKTLTLDFEYDPLKNKNVEWTETTTIEQNLDTEEEHNENKTRSNTGTQTTNETGTQTNEFDGDETNTISAMNSNTYEPNNKTTTDNSNTRPDHLQKQRTDNLLEGEQKAGDRNKSEDLTWDETDTHTESGHRGRREERSHISVHGAAVELLQSGGPCQRAHEVHRRELLQRS